ncbi:hypothetical protein GF325_05470 [Candidatus Bathyarchaeota archaeon]|nr:hypothetical protein [Candidatus Bathyarchaeota archaeon]
METNESQLHLSLKCAIAQRVGGQEEADVIIEDEHYRIDVLDERRNIAHEVQVGNLGKKFYGKVCKMMKQYQVQITYPIPVIQHLFRTGQDGETLEPKTVHKRNDYYTFFQDLVSFRVKFREEKIRFNLLLVEEKVEQVFAGFKYRRPHYRSTEHYLVNVLDEMVLKSPGDFFSMLPGELPDSFTNKNLANKLDIKGGPRRKKKIAGAMTYSLCLLGILKRMGKVGNAHVFSIANGNAS